MDRIFKQQNNCIQTSGVNRERHLNQIRSDQSWTEKPLLERIFSQVPGKRNRICLKKRIELGLYLLKCSFIRSSEMFLGRFPTQRCLVSRTMISQAASERQAPPNWPLYSLRGLFAATSGVPHIWNCWQSLAFQGWSLGFIDNFFLSLSLASLFENGRLLLEIIHSLCASQSDGDLLLGADYFLRPPNSIKNFKIRLRFKKTDVFA